MDNLYLRIGKTVVLFQKLELCVNGLLVELLKVSWDKGLCLTSEMSFSKLVAALKSVSHVGIKPGDILDDINQLCSELNVCEQLRNNIIHSCYSKGNNEGNNYAKSRMSAKQRKGLDKRIEFISAEKIDEAIDTIDETTKHLLKIVSELKKHKVVTDEFFR